MKKSTGSYKIKPESIKNDDDKAANSRFAPTTLLILIDGVVLVLVLVFVDAEGARGLQIVGAIAVKRKLRSSEQKASGEDDNGDDVKRHDHPVNPYSFSHLTSNYTKKKK